MCARPFRASASVCLSLRVKGSSLCLAGRGILLQRKSIDRKPNTEFNHVEFLCPTSSLLPPHNTRSLQSRNNSPHHWIKGSSHIYTTADLPSGKLFHSISFLSSFSFPLLPCPIFPPPTDEPSARASRCATTTLRGHPQPFVLLILCAIPPHFDHTFSLSMTMHV